MRFTNVPPYQFPTTTLFLDDNHDFLLNFVLQLDEDVAYRLFESPTATLEYINNKSSEIDLWKQTKEPHPQLTSFHEPMYNMNRFSEVSILIVDYAMPEMDGLALCRQIAHTPIKKILLTGKADEKLAISAFNEGLIQRYVNKSDFNAAEQITNAIRELQFDYFQSISDIVMRRGWFTPPLCLNNAAFAEMFYLFCRNKHIVEFYLIDLSGSFILLNEDRKPYFLLVKSKDEMALLAKKAAASGLNQTIITALYEGKKIPGTTSLNNDNWYQSLLSAKTIESHGFVYHYAVTESLPSFPFNATDLYSYHSYLEALDAEALLDE